MKRLFTTLTIIALLVIPQFALGDDVEDLKAAYEKGIQAYDSLDTEALASMVHQGMVSYGYNAAFPNVMPMKDTKEYAARGMKMEFSNLEYIHIAPYNMQYRVIGDTGIVWGHYTAYYKPKGEPLGIQHARITSTWIKKDGKWHMVMSHSSAIPPSN